MGYDFFVSYSRGNNNELLKKFLGDLSDNVRQRRGLAQGVDVGFFDQNDLERGSEWAPEVYRALCTSQCLLPIYSPAFFKSPYCGKEWRILHDRRASYGAAGKLPAVIKPVMWMPPASDPNGQPILPPGVHADVGKIQYFGGDPHADVNRFGVRHVLQRLRDYERAYLDFVDALASDIVTTADEIQLPDLEVVTPLEDVHEAFPLTVAPAAAAAPPVGCSSTRHVRFVFVAADPKGFKPGERAPDAYLDTGAGDWRPFYPLDKQRIFSMAQLYVADEELDYSSSDLPFGKDLGQAVGKALADRQIVVVLVDPWTLEWSEGYREILHEFDKQNFLNCTVLVPWNDNDEVLTARRTQIEQMLRDTFYFRSASGPIFFRSGIRSRAELRDALKDIVTRLSAEMRRRLQPRNPLAAVVSRPMVTGPAG